MDLIDKFWDIADHVGTTALVRASSPGYPHCSPVLHCSEIPACVYHERGRAVLQEGYSVQTVILAGLLGLLAGLTIQRPCRTRRFPSVGLWAKSLRPPIEQETSASHVLPSMVAHPSSPAGRRVHNLGIDVTKAPAAATVVPRRVSPTLETESKIWIDDIEAECTIRVYSTANPKIEVVAIVKGNLQGQERVPARVHSECFTGDIFASKRCDCGQQLHKFLRILNAERCGVLLYIRGHEGRGIGLSNKIKAYHLQDKGLDTVDANLRLGFPVDTRTYEDALSVLRHLGLKSIRLYTNNPDKMNALQVITDDVVALASVPCVQNLSYLRAQRERLNHRTILGPYRDSL